MKGQTQTEKLIDDVARRLFLLDYPNAKWEEEVPPVRMFFLAKARVAVETCKESGLVWYDGKRDKFEEIEIE